MIVRLLKNSVRFVLLIVVAPKAATNGAGGR